MTNYKIGLVSSWKDLLRNRDAVVFDMNGVIQDPVSGKKYRPILEVLSEIKSQRTPVYIVSNSTMAEDVFINKLASLGYEYGKDYNWILSSGMAVNSLLNDEDLLKSQDISLKNKKIYSIGHVFSAIIESSSFELTEDIFQADFAYLGIPQITNSEYELLSEDIKKGFTKSYIVEGNWDVLASSAKAVEYFYSTKINGINLKIVNANQDKIVDEKTPYGTVSLARQGFFAEIAEREGKSLVKIGKPYSYIYSLFTNQILKSTGKKKANFVYFGDNMQTDIAGLNNFKKSEKSFVDDNTVSVLCLNEYWMKNDDKVSSAIKLVQNGNLDKGKELLCSVIVDKAISEKIFPDYVAVWEKGS